MKNLLLLSFATTSKKAFILFLLYMLISIILFFLIREIVLWYFRINKNTENLERIADSLQIIAMQGMEESEDDEYDLVDELKGDDEEEMGDIESEVYSDEHIESL